MFNQKQNESGQALIATAIMGISLVAAIIWVADMGELFNRKTKAQIAADAAASAGSAYLANSLNMLKITNYVLVGAVGLAGLTTVLGHAEGQEGVKAIEALQESIIKADGAPAMALAVSVGKAQGVDRLNPFNYNVSLGKFDNPHLEVVRKKTKVNLSLLQPLTGWSGKLAMDDIKKDERRPYGERYVYVGAINNISNLQAGKLLSMAKSQSKFNSIVSSSLFVVTGGKLWPLGRFFTTEMAPVSVLKRKGYH